MKIAFLNIYQNKVDRGAETFVKEVAARLSKNHEVDILTKVSFKKYDVVIPTNGRLQAFMVRLITFFYGFKMIISGQSGIGFDDRINLYSFPDCFVSVSKYAVRWARKINPFVKSVYIPNGVDLTKFGQQIKSLNINLPKPIILAVAALESDKRLNLAIKAVSKLSNGTLLIIGKGSQEQNLKSLGAKLLPGRFKIMSFPHSEMPKVYAASDIFTYPTVPWESFGIAMVEAMASNLPVVATNDPIRREIVGRAGVFVDPKNTVAYSKALELALRIKWGKRPRKRAEKFSWDKIAEKYDNLFKNL